MAAVWTAISWTRQTRRRPIVSGIASGLMPGWGQLLNGDRVRALFFVGSLWVVGCGWLLSSSLATDLLNFYAPIVSPFEQSARSPQLIWAVKWATPLLIWAMAVYDAVTSAARQRHRA